MEPRQIESLVLTGAETGLPNLPSEGIVQITVRSRDVAWEWRVTDAGAEYFWMEAGDILVMPFADQSIIEQFRFRRAASSVGTCDIRIIYES